MKIRTDFVTNSSSSSYVVELALETIDGKEYSATIAPGDGGGAGSANINCKAKSLLLFTHVDTLLRYISSSLTVKVGQDSWDEEPCDYAELDFFEQPMQDFVREVQENVPRISDISTITLRRIWRAYGEAAYNFGWNISLHAPELLPLAESVCAAEGPEKEAAKEKLITYLDKLKIPKAIRSEWGDKFPSGFMGASAKSAVDWRTLTEDIEELAGMIVNDELPGNDYGEETVVVDMQRKKVTNSAKLFLRALED